VQVPKPTSEDQERFRALVPDDPRVAVKPMFGNLGAFVNGNMFAGLFGGDIGVKVAPAEQHELASAGGGPFGPAERPMSGYLALPPDLDADEATGWLQRALDHVAAVPPKKPKPRKPSAR
jgi:TfoX/Sxy family transcriptional regulator of competence genes